MRRFAIAFLAVPLAALLAVAPVAADTGPGGSGTYFYSDSTNCSTSSGRQVCTDTNISVGPNGDGTSSACLDIFTFSVSSTGRFTFVSDQYGCALAGTVIVASDYSVTLASTDISMQTCKAHKRTCSGSTIVNVSASDSVSGAIVTSTTRSTTTDGNCTYKTTINETDANLVGTLTIDGTNLDEQGFLSVVKQTLTIRCK
jgi:hypothetical protein